MPFRASSLVAPAVLSAVALASCGGDDGPKVTIYSGRTENLIEPILDEFEDETGIDVEVRYGQSADLALLIEEEAAAGSTEVDVFLSQSPGSIGYLDELGRLAPLPQDVLDLVPPAVRDDDGRWIGFSGRQRVLVYNTDLVEEADLPTSVLDLVTSERFQGGEIGVAPGNGSFQDFVTAMRVTEGEEATGRWLSDLAAADPVTYENNNAVVAAVGRGEVSVGLVNHYYNFRALAENPAQPTANHHFAEDDPGSLLIVTGAAVVEGTEQPTEAAQLVRFLLGPSGQSYFSGETFEYPLALGAEPPAELPAITFGDVSGIDVDELAGGLEQTRQMIVDAGFQG